MIADKVSAASSNYILSRYKDVNDLGTFDTGVLDFDYSRVQGYLQCKFLGDFSTLLNCKGQIVKSLREFSSNPELVYDRAMRLLRNLGVLT